MTTARLDLQPLRLALLAVAVLLALIAAAPNGASAEPNTGSGPKTVGQQNCENAGGTWTVEGTTATCKGRRDGQSHSCNLKVNPNGTACSHLPGSGRPARKAGGNPRDIHVVGVDTAQASAPEATPAPTYVASHASDVVFSMSPLDE